MTYTSVYLENQTLITEHKTINFLYETRINTSFPCVQFFSNPFSHAVRGRSSDGGEDIGV